MRKWILSLAAVLCLCACTNSGLIQSREIDNAADAVGAPKSKATVSPDNGAERMQLPQSPDPYLGVDISFLAAGDNLIHPNIYMDAERRGTAEKKYDFLPAYADVADRIADADIAFINQETVMAGEEYGYSGWPTFNSPQQLGKDLVTLGFDIVNIANNHMLDRGAAGLESTYAFWKEQPVILVGTHMPEDPYPCIFEKDGIKIALLSYTYGTNGIVKSADSPIDVPYIDENRIVSELQTVRETADFVIVSIHWGLENTYTPTDEQTSLAKTIAENGADVILGHHSHCLQPITWIDNGSGGRTLCIYSLSNFVSGMARPMNMIGGLFTFRIQSDGEGGLIPAEPLFTPTVYYFNSSYYETHLYLLEDYTDAIAATHWVQLNSGDISPATAKKIVTDVIDASFLPDWLRE